METYRVEAGMKLGIVDLGSNSFRVLLGTYDGSTWQNEPKQLWTTRLGQRDAQGLLTEEAMERGLQALEEICAVLDAYGATIRIGLATSAIREAENGRDFLERAQKICPMEYRVVKKRLPMDLRELRSMKIQTFTMLRSMWVVAVRRLL